MGQRIEVSKDALSHMLVMAAPQFVSGTSRARTWFRVTMTSYSHAAVSSNYIAHPRSIAPTATSDIKLQVSHTQFSQFHTKHTQHNGRSSINKRHNPRRASTLHGAPARPNRRLRDLPREARPHAEAPAARKPPELLGAVLAVEVS